MQENQLWEFKFFCNLLYGKQKFQWPEYWQPRPGLDSLHVADFLDAIRNNCRPN